MVVFDLKSLSILNQIAAPITQSQDAFSLLHYDDRTFFVGSNNGTLKAYNHQFIDMFTYKALEQYSPKLIASDATYLLIVEQAQQFNKSRIRLLYRISGAVISSSLLQKNIIGLQMISKDRAFLISKIINGIELLDYDVKRGVSRQLQQLNNSSEVFLSFDKFKNGGFLFVTNQGMYTFTLPNQLNRFSNRPVENVNYDKLRDEILMVNEDTLVVFDATTLLQKQSILFPEKLKAALPWSNR